jgi:hypothetical protein
MTQASYNKTFIAITLLGVVALAYLWKDDLVDIFKRRRERSTRQKVKTDESIEDLT